MRRFDHNQGAAKSCKREPTYFTGVSARDEGPTILPQSSARSQPNPQSMEELYLPPSADPRPPRVPPLLRGNWSNHHARAGAARPGLQSATTGLLKTTGSENYGFALGILALRIFRVSIVSKGFPC